MANQGEPLASQQIAQIMRWYGQVRRKMKSKANPSV